MGLADLMNTSVLSVTPDTTLAEAAHRMVDHDTGAACVIEDGKLVGVLSERDLLRVLAQGFDPDLKVSDRMVGNVLTGSAAELAPWLASHPDVRALDLTGAGQHNRDR